MTTVLSALGAFALTICIVQCGSFPIEDPTNLIDLPVELQMLIYKNLNVKDLIQLSKTHPHNQAIVELTFKDKYSKSKFDIDNNKYGYVTVASIVTSGNIIEEIDFDTILDAFQLFGHLIQKLRIFFHPLRDDTQKLLMLNEHISRYLSESLTEIALGYLYDQYLEGLQGPFTKIKNVKLGDGGCGNIRSNDTNFSEMFPAIQQLDLYGMQYFNPNTLVYHFPHLEFIRFDSWITGHDRNDMAAFEQSLKLNPQLRHLSFLRADFTILEIVSKNLPNVERLEINEFRDSFSTVNSEDIYFSNLKVLTIQTPNAISAGVERVPILFGNLEEFVCGPPLGLWFDIIVQNKQIKKLSTSCLNDWQFSRVADQCPNLEEFSINFPYYGMNSNDFMSTIRRFVEKANQIKKFSIRNSPLNPYDTLIDQLKPKWNVTTGEEDLIFHRD